MIAVAMIVVATASYALIIVDASSGMPLAGVSIFSNQGRLLGVTSGKGEVPSVAFDAYPLTARSIGFKERSGILRTDSAVGMQTAAYELPELIVDSKKHEVLHLLALVRDYSTLATYSDTVTMYREKWVDFMIPTKRTKKFSGWRAPRILSTNSFYRFTDINGLDSVSDNFNQHFSWSDWVGILDHALLPQAIAGKTATTDTTKGKYGPTEIWTARDNSISLFVNVLADTISRKWVPNLSNFFKNHIDFETFTVNYQFSEIYGDDIYATDLDAFSINIASRGRGHNMFKFNRRDQPFFVTTYAEIYIVDKEFISRSEAIKWENHSFAETPLDIPVPPSIPPLPQATSDLIARVESIDHTQRRLNIAADEKLVGIDLTPLTKKQKTLRYLKSLIGL